LSDDENPAPGTQSTGTYPSDAILKPAATADTGDCALLPSDGLRISQPAPHCHVTGGGGPFAHALHAGAKHWPDKLGGCVVKVPLVILTVAVPLLAAAVPAKAADFACIDARTPVERIVCANLNLSRLDDRMARLYGWLWAALDDSDRHALRDEQRVFLSTRDACGADRLCITTSYQVRIQALSVRLRQITRGASIS